MQQQDNQDSIYSVQVSRVTLSGGRYLIFYTFDKLPKEQDAIKEKDPVPKKDHRSSHV